jgi:tetratricopeptide (TPR) repeat protein
MSRSSVRCLLSISLLLLGARAGAQAPAAAHVEETARKEAAAPAAVAPVAAASRHQLFGTLPIATRSDDARKLLEKSIDQYENELLGMSVDNAHKAANKDSHFALAYAIWSYAASHTQPVPDALQKAKALAPRATPDEQLLVNWLVDVQQGDNLAAIGAMNDLLARFPTDKHVLYLTAEWLYFQQDYDRSRRMMEKIIEIDPNFPPALNMVGMGDTYALMGDYAHARAEYDKAVPMATNSRDRLHAQFQKALVYFWEGQPESGRKALASLADEAARQKDAYAQFEIGFGRADLAASVDEQLDQLRALEATVEKPVSGMSEPDRHLSWASVVREEARIAAQIGRSNVAQEAIFKLENSAALTRDLIVTNSYESARGFLLFAQGDFAGAADELASDPQSTLALQQLALAQEKLGNTAAAESTRTRLKYQRAPTVEWYLTTRSAPADSH